MDVLKPVLFAFMAAVLFVMWSNQDFVIDAYTDESAPTEIRLSGLALDFEKTELPASPYVVHIGEDTRRKPMALLFTDSGEQPMIEMAGGKSRIEGTVDIDGVAAVGSTVRLERHTDAGIGVRDLAVNANGWFAAHDLPGGRYRVRAWVPGTATMTTSDVFFINAGDRVQRSYSLEVVDGEPLIQFANGGTMYTGMTGSLGASVTQHRVDEDGIVVTRPVSGIEVSVELARYLQPMSGTTLATDDQGLVVFRLRCLRPGQGTATVTFNDSQIPVALPACVNAPPTTQPPADDGSGTGRQGDSSSSTTSADTGNGTGSGGTGSDGSDGAGTPGEDSTDGGGNG